MVQTRNNQDTDGDGLIDEDEVRITITDPNNVDTDGDGLIDEAEVEGTYNDGTSHGLGDINPDNPDIDYDGLTDLDEVNMRTDPNNPDNRWRWFI